LNISLGCVELFIATEEGIAYTDINEKVSHFGAAPTIITLFYEFVKLIITSGIILMLWNAGFYITSYIIALVPYIVMIPVVILLVGKETKYTQMIVQ
jgi:hypothetical protein